jgi:superfamily II DNA or RNA helicase
MSTIDRLIVTHPLRDYQIELISQIEDAIAQGHRRIMLQLPTGAGKTRCFVELVKNHRFAPYTDGVHNCLIIAHRTELINQAIDDLKRELKTTPNICIGRIQAGHELSPRCSIQVASIQTLNSKLDRKQWVPPAGLVIIDEAHHATAKSYQKAIEHYSNAIILGVTATPIRTDGKGFKDSFDILIKGPSISELTAKQHLCPFRLFAYYIQRINLRNVSTRAGDYDLHQLADAVAASEVRADLVKTWEQYAKGKRTVVFAVNIKLSKEYAEAYSNAGYVAEHVDGETPDAERKKILERFTKGEIQILCNCSIVTEGFNLPEMECVQIVRPTKSLSLWLQMVGRSLRIADDKTEAIILDHTDNYQRLGLPDTERNWTLDGIDRKLPPKSAKLKVSTRDGDRKLEHREGELLEVYSNLENNKTTLEIPLIVKSFRELLDQSDRDGLRMRHYEFSPKGGRKKSIQKGEEEVERNIFTFFGNLVEVEGVGEFLIKGDIYFYKSYDPGSDGQYILYWTINNGELVDQQLDDLSSSYRSKYRSRFEKLLESQIEAKRLDLEAKRLAKDRRNAESSERLKALIKPTFRS